MRPKEIRDLSFRHQRLCRLQRQVDKLVVRRDDGLAVDLQRDQGRFQPNEFVPVKKRVIQHHVVQVRDRHREQIGMQVLSANLRFGLSQGRFKKADVSDTRHSTVVGDLLGMRLIGARRRV